MAKKTIEVEIGTKPTGKVDHSTGGKTHPMPEKQKSEVGGREYYWRLMECWNCHGTSNVWYDTINYHHYTCCYCGADNVL